MFQYPLDGEEILEGHAIHHDQSNFVVPFSYKVIDLAEKYWPLSINHTGKQTVLCFDPFYKSSFDLLLFLIEAPEHHACRLFFPMLSAPLVIKEKQLHPILQNKV